MRLAFAALITVAAVASPAAGDVAKPRAVMTYVKATCRTWVNELGAAALCRDIPFDQLAVGTCLSRECGSSTGGVAKFEDGIYRGAFDGGYPGKGEGRLERFDGVVVEGNFRRGEMWRVTVTFPGGLLWKGELLSEVRRNAFGEWQVYHDVGSTRSASTVRFGSLFLKPGDRELSAAQARLRGDPAASPAPAPLTTDLTPVVQRELGGNTSAVTTGEIMACYGFFAVMADHVPTYGRNGLPEDFAPERLTARRRAWEGFAKAAYKKRDDMGSFAKDLADAMGATQTMLDKGDMHSVAQIGGSCLKDPHPS